MKKFFVLVIILFVGTSVIGPSINADICNVSVNRSSYTPHDPIYIHGNDDFTSENGVTGGSGTLNDPYFIEDWEINASSEEGIIIRNTSVFFEIRNCYVHDGGSNYDGIVFYNITNGVIKNNFITKNRNGTIFRTQGFGMKENSCNNKITKNNITDNKYDGIHFEHTTFGHHSDNAIFLNNITGNTRGIFLIMSHENLIYSNNIISNSKFGVELFICTGGGANNKVYHNNFINNGDEDGQAYVWGTANDWDDGYPSGGNYWSDYDGVDNYSGPYQNIPGSDGIGDEPYEIHGYDEWDYDFYPLMEPYGNVTLPPFTFISFDPSEPDGDNDWYVSNVTVTLKAEDDTGVNATYFRINGGEWETYESPFVISEDGEDIIVEYYSVDIDGNIEDVKSATIDIDQTPPETCLEWETWMGGWLWYVKFILNATDEISGMVPWLEFYLNDILQDEFEVNWPTFELTIQWFKSFKTVTFGFGCYDMAGNLAFESVNGSDINSHPRSYFISQQSNYLWFQKFFVRFPFIQQLLDFLGSIID